jgi:hypothetical protein
MALIEGDTEYGQPIVDYKTATLYPTGTTYNPTPTTSTPTAAKPTTTTTTTAPAPNPQWVFAVNMPSTYPDYAAMKAAGAGIVIVADDPNAQLLINAARQWGIPVAIQVNAPPGITPEQYAARVQAAQALSPDRLVLDIESAGKGYEGSDGWNFSESVAALIKPIVGSTAVAVTMEPHQSDYNYQAFVGLSSNSATQFWVQSYTGDMTAVPTDWALSSAQASGIAGGQIIPILGPGQTAPTGTGWASYGIPTTSAGGIYSGYGPTGIQAGPYDYPGGTIPTGGGTTTSGGGGGSTGGGGGGSTGGGTTTGTDWASAYFGNLGLPADVQKQVNSIFSKYPDDAELAVALARQYIRTTPWFSQNFPGFFEGLRAGLFSDETGYRGYVNQANVYTQQYFGRPVSVYEIESALHQGITPEILGRTYEAGAIARAQGGEELYQLAAFGDVPVGEDQRGQVVSDLSRQQAGLTSNAGAKLQAALDRATKRMQALFGGQLAIPNTAGQALAPKNLDIGA